jgi:rod shape-determining protein MreD
MEAHLSTSRPGGRLSLRGRAASDLYIQAFLVLLLIFLQATIVARVGILGMTPNLMLVAVVSWSMLRGINEALVWAFAGGVGLDLVTGLPLGSSALALMPPCFLASIGHSRLVSGSILLPALVVVLATPIYGWIVMLTLQLRGVPLDWAAATLQVIGPEIIANLVIVPIVYPLLRWLARSARPPLPGAGVAA